MHELDEVPGRVLTINARSGPPLINTGAPPPVTNGAPSCFSRASVASISRTLTISIRRGDLIPGWNG